MLKWSELTTRQLAILALLAFVLTRAFFLFHEPVMTDMKLYYELAKRASWGEIEVYKDFPFAYPFLSWFAIAWPPLFDGQLTFEVYQTCLHVFFFLLEATTVALFIYYFRNHTPRLRLFLQTLFFYSLISALQFNLIYDRVDLLMILALIAIFVSWESWIGTSFIAAFLIKLVPIALWPFKFLELWRLDRKRALMSLWIPVCAFFLLVASDYLFYPRELAALSNHSSRGIQLESLWATPFLLLHIFGIDPNGHSAYVFGAQEVQSDFLTDGLLLIAKYAGFAVLALLYFFGRIEMKTVAGRARGFLIFLFAFLCFQRVLSTQFFLWTAPFLALSLALEFRWSLLIISFMAFALTAMIFDPGYGDLINYDPFFVIMLTLRNTLLLSLFALSFRRLRRLRRLSWLVGNNEVENDVNEERPPERSEK